MTQIKYQKKQGLVHFKNKVAKTFLAFYENGYQSPPRLFQLNDVCFEILRLLEAPKTADEIASCLSVKYPDDKKQAAADANRYLKFLLDNGLIGEARDGGYRVLFVYPHIRGKSNSAFPPIGLLSLGACLEEKGGGAKIYDFQLQGSDARALFKHIEDNSYDVIGFSANSVNVDLALQLSAAVRAFFPEKRIIFGGPHSTFEHEKILNNHPEIDMVFLGEAELSIFPGLQFLFSNFYGEPPANVAFRRNGRVECARKAQEPFDLGSLKVLDFSKIVNMKNAEEYPEYPVMTARGCPFNCSFCTSAAFWGHKYRCRSIPGVIDEIRQAKLKYGYKEFNIVDDTLTADRERFLEFCREVKKEKIRWACLSRVDGIDAEVLSNMREAGCYAIFFGIESLDASALESVHKFRKKMSEDYLREVIEMCVKEDFKLYLSCIVGLPNETNVSMRKTLDFFRYFKDKYPAKVSVTLNFIALFPGTEIFRKGPALGYQRVDGNSGNLMVTPAYTTKHMNVSDMWNAYARMVFASYAGKKRK